MEKVNKQFFKVDALQLSKNLLGKILVRNDNGNLISGKIIETEAYIANVDKASHAYNGRKTERVMPLYEAGGISYVYFIYGKYFCFNVISGEKGNAQGVLVRALEPLENLDAMSKNRFNKSYSELSKRQILNLTSGPSKLCMALNINREMNRKDLTGNELYICESNFKYKENDIVKCKRIGIDYAEEAINFPWRFYVKGNPYVSVKDKEAEKNLN